MGKRFYITTTLPYVNADPHVGFAMELIRADVVARHKRQQGYEVFFNTGTDEHGAKIHESAVKENIPVQDYVDTYAAKFKDLVQLLTIEDPHFIRTTDERHILAAQAMWNICNKNGYIYKKTYKAKYCVGCELNKTDSELVDGKCPLHPNRDLEFIDEENYFFKFSAFQERLLELYKNNPTLVVPDFRFNEIKAFVERGLEDFSISRLKTKMPWGVPVPGDDDHVMYVWFDALTSYISTLGWGTGEEEFSFWREGTPVQYCGKDNLRQQSAIWQAMLMASGLPDTKHIIIDGFINSGGQKMSKSLGNVISPFDVINEFKALTEYPEEVLRFVLLHEIPSFEDGDVTMDSIKIAYTTHLANGVGNLTSRIMKLATLYDVSHEDKDFSKDEELHILLDAYDTQKALRHVMQLVNDLDGYIQETEAFKVIKEDVAKGKDLIGEYLARLHRIAGSLALFMPKTSATILGLIKENKMPETPLFSRLT